jgi:hypothetical protein
LSVNSLVTTSTIHFVPVPFVSQSVLSSLHFVIAAFTADTFLTDSLCRGTLCSETFSPLTFYLGLFLAFFFLCPPSPTDDVHGLAPFWPIQVVIYVLATFSYSP